MPFLGFLFVVPGFIIDIILKVVEFIASLSFAIVPLSNLVALGVIALYGIIFACSHVVNLKGKLKLTTIITMVMLLVVTSFASATPVYNNFCISTIQSYDDTVYAIEYDKTIFMVGDFDKYSVEKSKKFLENRHIESTYLLNFNDDNFEGLGQKLSFVKFSENDELLEYNRPHNLGGVTITLINRGQKNIAFVLEGEQTVIVFGELATPTQITNLALQYDAKVVICETDQIDRVYLDGTYILNNGTSLEKDTNGEFFTHKNLKGSFEMIFTQNKLNKINSLD